MTEIIAEVGINHNGDMTTALNLIDASVMAGADAVKFQTFNADLFPEPQRSICKPFQLTHVQFRTLKSYCEQYDMEFMSTPFDKEAVDFLAVNRLVKRFKIGSGQAKDQEFVEYVASRGLPVILSTGMSEFADIRHVLANVEVPVTILHCVSEYPTIPKHANLPRMQRMMQEFACPIGYSDHTVGIEIALAAAALGATVIEKHITLDRNQEGPDHFCSANPEDFAALVAGVKKIEDACLSE